MIQILDIEQGSPEWFAARMGMPTASEFHTVLAKGRNGNGGDPKASKTRRTYMLKLAGEIVTGEPMEAYTNAHMERGKAMEDEARDAYSFLTDADLTRVGFITNRTKLGNGGRDIRGCSPDALIGDQGMLEIKTALPHILIGHLLADVFPLEHKPQCQGCLWVAERDWIDICIFWPKLPLFVRRAFRDDGYIANLAGAVDAFNAELHEIVERVRSYGGMREAA